MAPGSDWDVLRDGKSREVESPLLELFPSAQAEENQRCAEFPGWHY